LANAALIACTLTVIKAISIAANASCIITGDGDLLALNPFRNILILNTVDFFNKF